MNRLCACLPTLAVATAALAQTWTTAGPGLRSFPRLHYDTARGETVLFASPPGTAVDPTDYTWIWNGDSWTRRATSQAPPTSTMTGCYDEDLQRFVALVATVPATTWLYDGSDWSPLPTAHVPPSRQGAAIAYDPVRRRVVIFGGWTQYGLAYDTWEFDGVDWHSVGSLPAPPVRAGAAMGFDRARNCLVLHGGSANQGGPLHDTFEWVGGAWQPVITAHWPPYARTLHWLPARQRLAMVHGTSGYEFTGTDWQTFAVPSPGVDIDLLAYDTARQRLVQVGRSHGNDILVDDVREYQGTSWQARQQGAPDAVDGSAASDFVQGHILLQAGTNTWRREEHGWSHWVAGGPSLFRGQLVHDPAQDRFLLCGLLPAVGPWQVWALRGRVWQQVAAANPPPTDQRLTFAFDTRRGVLVGFGTPVAPQGAAGRTFEFDGSDWHQVATPTTPSPRSLHAMAYDPGLGATVLFGGNDGTLTPLADTWLYDGTDWRQQLTAHGPPGLQGMAMAHDPWRGRVMLHGGFDGYDPLLSAATWEFDGVDWQALPTTGERVARQRHALAVDPRRGTLLAVGGTSHPTTDLPAEPRTYDLVRPPAATVVRYGIGCGATAPPSLAAAPGSAPSRGGTLLLEVGGAAWPGASFLALGFGIDRWSGLPLPVDLGPVGLPGCRLWIAAEPALGSFAVHSGPIGTHALPLPNDPALAGAHLAAQALVLDGTAPQPTLTQALLVTMP